MQSQLFAFLTLCTLLVSAETDTQAIIRVSLEWGAIVLLVCFSGLFSGLNLGLMSLDPIGLQIVMASDNKKDRECAEKIQPLRKRGNWLLCTLLIGNVAVNAALSILLADKTSGTVGFFVSTAVITVFGEIVPQALCSRYALKIGSMTVWIVWPLVWIMAVIAYPIAYILDRVLGDELGTVYTNKELAKLVEIHAELEGTGVNNDTAGMLKGALDLKDAQIEHCMTDMKDVFWLSDESTLSFDVLTEIFKNGHSRIPIFDQHNRSIGLLYVKDLILLDPDDEMPVTQIMKAFNHKSAPTVWKNDTLQHLLEIFVKTRQHLALVCEEEQESHEYVGIITLEDVIEHVLQTELIDEHDNFVDNERKLRTNRLSTFDWSMLHIFDHRQRVLTTLPPQELQAVYHFLSQTVKQFSPKNRLFTEASVKNLLATSSVLRVVVSMQKEEQGQKRDPYKDIEDNGLLIYQRDKKTKYFTLLLDGKCEIYAGRQGFRCELTRWSHLCPEALEHVEECFRMNKPFSTMDYVPDFTAKVTENSRLLRIKLDDFRACLEGKFDSDFFDKINTARNPLRQGTVEVDDKAPVMDKRHRPSLSMSTSHVYKNKRRNESMDLQTILYEDSARPSKNERGLKKFVEKAKKMSQLEENANAEETNTNTAASGEDRQQAQSMGLNGYEDVQEALDDDEEVIEVVTDAYKE